MTATGHALIGTVIAAKIGNPAIAAPLALASHFLADAFPHWDTGTHGREKTREKFILESFMDVILGFSLSYLLIVFVFPETNIVYAFTMIILAQLPDWLTAPYLFFNKRGVFHAVYKLQKVFDNRLDKPWGFINQVAVIASLIALARVF